MGLPELREKVEAEVKCQEHLRKILDSDPKMRAAIIFFAARNFLKYQVKILAKKWHYATVCNNKKRLFDHSSVAGLLSSSREVRTGQNPIIQFCYREKIHELVTPNSKN